MKTKKLLVLFIFMLGFSLCSFSQHFSLTKRQYRKGYYIQRNEKTSKIKREKNNPVVLNEKQNELKSDEAKLSLEKAQIDNNVRTRESYSTQDPSNNAALLNCNSSVKCIAIKTQKKLTACPNSKKSSTYHLQSIGINYSDQKMIDNFQSRIEKMKNSAKVKLPNAEVKEAGGTNAALVIGLVLASASLICLFLVSMLVGLILACLALIFVIIGAIIRGQRNRAAKDLD